ncbi:hypothetical protein BCR37DRAFT_390733 [Protomyces lactucae-debilis]|uniref:Uncharacterized protein n=1 Tax=Protomyces lactucae-debilis TaxID=2754530 RepID=A0A1Y2FWI1_PROLT|nr:uncharacterized protein BCR37DRAFT_390733 [Protomyces lactucae-debilis]ORY87015.1 hypothetical protein BCR37DRAFT_390733 [Protomyces lactucae-debilis]
MLDRLAPVLDRDAAITQQTTLIAENKAQLQKQQVTLETLVKQAQAHAKTLGDVRNWTEMMEHEIEVLELALKKQAVVHD